MIRMLLDERFSLHELTLNIFLLTQEESADHELERLFKIFARDQNLDHKRPECDILKTCSRLADSTFGESCHLFPRD